MKLIAHVNNKITLELSDSEFIQLHAFAIAIYEDYESFEYENVKMEREEVRQFELQLARIFQKIF